MSSRSFKYMLEYMHALKNNPFAMSTCPDRVAFNSLYGKIITHDGETLRLTESESAVLAGLMDMLDVSFVDTERVDYIV